MRFPSTGDRGSPPGSLSNCSCHGFRAACTERLQEPEHLVRTKRRTRCRKREHRERQHIASGDARPWCCRHWGSRWVRRPKVPSNPSTATARVSPWPPRINRRAATSSSAGRLSSRKPSTASPCALMASALGRHSEGHRYMLIQPHPNHQLHYSQNKHPEPASCEHGPCKHCGSSDIGEGHAGVRPACQVQALE